jgi:triosephosphate isomerase
MHKTVGEAQTFVRAFLPLVGALGDRDVVIAPPSLQLAAVAEALRGSPVAWAAQNVHPEEKGAFTGEVSPAMLADLGCAYTIVGHSERRALFGETSEFVAHKAAALLAHGIRPIVCVGETLEERESERTFEIVGRQLDESLSRVSDGQADVVVVAYEPVWAIGTDPVRGLGEARQCGCAHAAAGHRRRSRGGGQPRAGQLRGDRPVRRLREAQ